MGEEQGGDHLKFQICDQPCHPRQPLNQPNRCRVRPDPEPNDCNFLHLPQATPPRAHRVTVHTPRQRRHHKFTTQRHIHRGLFYSGIITIRYSIRVHVVVLTWV